MLPLWVPAAGQEFLWRPTQLRQLHEMILFGDAMPPLPAIQQLHLQIEPFNDLYPLPASFTSTFPSARASDEPSSA